MISQKFAGPFFGRIYTAMVDVGQSSALLEYILDVVPFRNAGDTNGTEVDNQG